MGVELKGADEVAKNFEKIQRMVEKNLIESMKKGGDDILEKSNALAPRNTGNMTRQTDVIIVDSKEVNVRYNEDYSLYVHEDMEKKHPKGGQAKFLQTATNDNGKDVIKKISEDLLK